MTNMGTNVLCADCLNKVSNTNNYGIYIKMSVNHKSTLCTVHKLEFYFLLVV